MNRFFFAALALIVFSAGVFAQKGVDTQTRTIRQETTPNSQTPDNPSDGFDFGRGKTKTRQLLDNPYRVNARRDVLVEAILNALKERKLVLDEASSRLSEGLIVTQPFVFARGSVISRSELVRYAVVPDSETAWRSGRYTLRIEIEPLDGVRNNVSVTAKVDGKAENGLTSEWRTLSSTGVAEDEFLVKLVEDVTGAVIDAPQQEKP